MRQFDYREKWKKLLTPEIVSYLTQIHEFRGEQTRSEERFSRNAETDLVCRVRKLPIKLKESIHLMNV